MRSLLVITNADAGTSDEERLAEALVVLREKASVEVAKTSNPGSGLLQDRRLDDDTTVTMAVVEHANQWNTAGNVGLVVGATYPA